MNEQHEDIGRRLKAFRIGRGLTADEVAKRIGISRTALFRCEKGDIAKIDTLEKLAELLEVSMPTLLGVGIEYIASAVSYFERTRQLEETADQIFVLAGPVSFLLASEKFIETLAEALRESVPEGVPGRSGVLSDIDLIVEILHERKTTYGRRQPGIVNLIAAGPIERFLRNGLMGRVRLPDAVRESRLAAARREVEHLVELIEDESIGVQIGLVTDTLPHNGFQMFRQGQRTTLTISPFRLGEQPNIRVGVAMVTAAPEAIALHAKIVDDAWRTALKGPAAAACLRDLLAANPSPRALHVMR